MLQKCLVFCNYWCDCEASSIILRLSFAQPSLNLRSTYRQGKQLLFISRCIFNHFVFFSFSLNSGYYFKTKFCIKTFSYGVVIKYI